jgi:hypothetical protein
MGVLREKSLWSAVRNMVLGVEITLLNDILAAVTMSAAVVVLMSSKG